MEEILNNIREVAVDAIEHVAMANYAHRETEAIKMVDDCIESIRLEHLVIKGVPQPMNLNEKEQ